MQHDYVLDNQSGAGFRADLNNALSSIVGLNSGATEPTTKYAFQLWADTTTGKLKIRNSINTLWIDVLNLNSGSIISTAVGNGSLQGITSGTNNIAIGVNSGSSITTGSNNVIIGGYTGTSALSDVVVLSTPAGVERLRADASGVVSVGGVPITLSVGTDSTLTRQMFKDCGMKYYDSTTTNALDYVNGSHQRWAPAVGAQTLSITNWPPTGNLGELLIEGVNLGAATITWPTINWVKSDGTTTTTFASNGVTLRASGTDWVLLWTRDAGTTIYGKVQR